MPEIAKQTGISKVEYKTKLKGILMYEAERIKLRISAEEDDVSEIFRFKFGKINKNILIDIKYNDFLKRIKKPFSQILNKIDEVMKNTRLSKHKIHSVILAGSSSRGP